jgi:hypothetical protein
MGARTHGWPLLQISELHYSGTAYVANEFDTHFPLIYSDTEHNRLI